MTQEHTPGQGLPIRSTARRRVAAWNSCGGISTEALEAGVVNGMLEALREIDAWSRRANIALPSPAIYAAIARAQGGAA